MWKLIFLGLIVWLVIYVLKRVINPTVGGQPSADQPNTGQSNESPVENMVQCSSCHVHIPRSEAFLVNGNFYCSKAHIENK